MKKRIAVVLVALVLSISCIIGTTLAWLVDDTETVTNTFIVGDINIDLWEHQLNDDGLTLNNTVLSSKSADVDQSGFKMIPGNTIDKDPTVTVEKGSEACWLFIKVEKSSNFDDFMLINLDSSWKQLVDTNGNNIDNVYYQEVASLVDATNDMNFPILAGGTYTATDINKDLTWAANEVFVLPTVTKTALNNITNGTESAPTLKFTAYAVQKDANVDTAYTAWTIATSSN